MQPSVVLSSLSTGYGSKVVTDDINAALMPAQLTCLLGPNGAGKSTLLKTLCTFIPPVRGSVTIMGRDLQSYSSSQLARVIGVVLTERPAAMNMTVRELVELGRSPYTSFFGGLRKADSEAVDLAIEQVGIPALARRRVCSLSDGERQKAFIAKALAQNTHVIILDEPTAFLDYPSKVDMMLLLRNIAHSQGKTVFMSTHDLDLALQTADTLWLLDSPHGLSIGSPSELAASSPDAKPALARYFETPNLQFCPESLSFKIVGK